MSKYKEYAEKPTGFLALTGYTRQEFEALLLHFGKCYYEWLKTHRLDGKPGGKRTYSDYKNSPLPTIEDKLLLILHYLKTNNLQTGPGALFGMSQPKAKALSDLDKHINQWLSSLPVRIEHAIGGVKRYRIVKDKIRCWKPGFKDAVFETCCGLHNFRLNFPPWNYKPIQLHLFVDF